MPVPASASGDPPELTAEMVLLRVQVEALVSVLGRKKAERYLRVMAEKLAGEENLSSVFPIRANAQHRELNKARQRAATMFQCFLPTWLAILPDE